MSLWNFYTQIQHPLILPLVEISRRGVCIDRDLRAQATAEYEAQEARLTAQLHALVGRPLDPHSPAQLMAYVYGEQGVKGITRQRIRVTGERRATPTLDEVAINELRVRALPAVVRQVLDLVVAIRATHKLLATYLRAPLDADHRLRCSYVIAGDRDEFLGGTTTGRLSSRRTPWGTGTNLQNVPHGIARRMVIPDPGMVFLGADYSQAEARVVAHLAGDRRLLAVFAAGGDVHRRAAATIFRVPEPLVTDSQRQLAKRVVHASNYGMGPQTFAREAGLSKPEAQRLLNTYFQTYPGIPAWHLRVADTLRQTRILTTPWGRRRQFFGAWGDDLLRQAYAYIPQSTVSDLLNISLVAYHTHGVGQIVLQVHDSVVIQVASYLAGRARTDLLTHFTRPLEIEGTVCTIPVTVAEGATWDDLH